MISRISISVIQRSPQMWFWRWRQGGESGPDRCGREGRGARSLRALKGLFPSVVRPAGMEAGAERYSEPHADLPRRRGVPIQVGPAGWEQQRAQCWQGPESQCFWSQGSDRTSSEEGYLLSAPPVPVERTVWMRRWALLERVLGRPTYRWSRRWSAQRRGQGVVGWAGVSWESGSTPQGSPPDQRRRAQGAGRGGAYWWEASCHLGLPHPPAQVVRRPELWGPSL